MSPTRNVPNGDVAVRVRLHICGVRFGHLRKDKSGVVIFGRLYDHCGHHNTLLNSPARATKPMLPTQNANTPSQGRRGVDHGAALTRSAGILPQ